MEWSILGGLFSFQIALGIFAFMALSSPAPVGPLYYRMNGAFALLGILLPWWITFQNHELKGSTYYLALGGTVLACAIFLLMLFPLKDKNRRVLLSFGVVGSMVALTASMYGLQSMTIGETVLFSLSAASSGMVVGGIGIAMVLGHWYLTVPEMSISHLVRINKVTIYALLAKTIFLGALLLVCVDTLNHEDNLLFRPMGYFHLGTRVVVGLAAPLLFGYMVSGCLKHKNTRSATGILYASTVLVILGEAIGLSLWGDYGVPL